MGEMRVHTKFSRAYLFPRVFVGKKREWEVEMEFKEKKETHKRPNGGKKKKKNQQLCVPLGMKERMKVGERGGKTHLKGV